MSATDETRDLLAMAEAFIKQAAIEGRRRTSEEWLADFAAHVRSRSDRTLSSDTVDTLPSMGSNVAITWPVVRQERPSCKPKCGAEVSFNTTTPPFMPKFWQRNNAYCTPACAAPE